MHLISKSIKFAKYTLGTTAILISIPALAIVESNKLQSGYGFVSDPSELRSSLNLPLTEKKETVSARIQTLKLRAKKAKSDERFEAPKISVPTTARGLAAFSKDKARPRQVTALYDYLTKKVATSTAAVQKDGTKRITLDATGVDLMNPDALTEEYSQEHLEVGLVGGELKKDKDAARELLRQLKPFLSTTQRKAIVSKINKGQVIEMDKDLLPAFAKKHIRSFTPFRGPNCFHAALSFQGENLGRSQYINVKEETGYHAAMVNYDELWRAIQAHFYEVKVSSSPLMYGDMIVFFELPTELRNTESINYRWIRHATTYLMGNYAFSKASKSADSPYTVKSLEDEWKTWKGYTKNLGAKVFRRATKNASTIPPVNLTDWIY